MKNISIGPLGLGRVILGNMIIALAIYGPILFFGKGWISGAFIGLFSLPFILFGLILVLWGIVLYRDRLLLVICTLAITISTAYPVLLLFF